MSFAMLHGEAASKVGAAYYTSRTGKIMSRSLVCFSIALALCAPTFAQRGGRGGGPGLPQNLQFRFMGPAVGNRISAATGVVGDLDTYYAGAASGGVWKSTDKGETWAPIFDAMHAMAIG